MANSVAFFAILFFLVGACHEIQGKSLNGSHNGGFIHLGSFKQQSGLGSRRAINLDENDYYISTVPLSWSAARQNCKFTFEDDSVDLLALESEEETNFVKKLLDAQAFAGILWTSGTFDTSSRVWRWASSGVPLPKAAWAPWKYGAPPTSPNSQLKVALAHRNEYDSVWQAQAISIAQIYVCEVPRVDTPVPCYATNDLAIVLDSSGSIGTANYQVAKEFVAQLASAFTVHQPSRLSLIVYSNGATVVIQLNSGWTPAQIDSAILSAIYYNGGTDTDVGINTAVDQFLTYPRSVPLNMVVLTDGYSNNYASTIAAANAAAARGVRSFSVGVTLFVNQQELLGIAGGNADRVFTLDTFDELIRILAPLSVRICRK